MSFTFKNVVVLVDGRRLSRVGNQVSFGGEYAVHDVTALEGGEAVMKGDFKGEWQLDLYDGSKADGETIKLLTQQKDDHEIAVLAAGSAAGKTAFFFRGPFTKRPFKGKVGDVRTGAVGGNMKEAERAATVLFSGLGEEGDDGVVTATTNGTAVEIGALGPGQTLTCVLQIADFPVLVGAETTLDVALESAVDAAFTVPQVVHNFTQVTAADVSTHVQRFTTTTANSDTFYRVVLVFNSTDPGGQIAPVVYITL